MTVRPRSEPVFYVRVRPEGGSDHRLDLSERVLSFQFDDSDRKADKLVLTVDNWDLSNFDDPVWGKGNLLEVAWGYPGEMAPARTVVIQKVTGFQTLNVEGHAKSVLMNRLARCRVFENKTRSQVAAEIAREHGYGPSQQDIEDTTDVLPAITQARLTDAQFLRRLASREGFEFYVDFEGLHFHQRRLGRRPVRAFRWYTAPEVGEVISINIENDVTAKPGAVRVRGRNPMTRKDIDEQGSNAGTKRDTLGEVIEIVDPETGATHMARRLAATEVRPSPDASSAAAKRRADAQYRRAQHTTVKLTAVALGDPGLAAKTVVEFQGLGQRLSGRYYVKEATHKIDGGGYTVELKCLRDGTGARGGVRSKGKPNRGKAADADPDKLREVEVVDPESRTTRIEYRQGKS